MDAKWSSVLHLSCKNALLTMLRLILISFRLAGRLAAIHEQGKLPADAGSLRLRRHRLAAKCARTYGTVEPNNCGCIH